LSSHLSLRLLPLVSLLLLSVLRANEANVLPNPGFEEGKTAWQVGEGDSLVTAEAARTGKLGLRILNDGTKAKGSNASSPTFVVEAGQPFTVSFWARANAKGAGVYLMYVSEKGRMVRDPATKGGLPMAAMKYGDKEWHEYTLKATVPKAAYGFKIWAHTWSTAKCVVDLDDFQITGLPEDTKVIIPKPCVAPAKPKPIDFANLPQRKTPTVIIIKLDDLKMHGKREHPRWDRVVEYMDKRGLKVTMGMLGNSLPEASPEYIQWIKERKASGNCEIWFHGWDHKTHAEADGKTYNEFNHRSLAEQEKRLADTQALCLEKLGFALTCFGPPGGVGNGSQSAETHQMMQDDPHMVAWLYPQPMDKLGKETMARGKVAILDRVWAVNLEGGVGAPDFKRFVRGYIQNLERPYFVLQGHPVMWDDHRFGQFTKIIDFLVEQKARFVLPSEYAAELKEQRK
jgi:peptidoglycan/xylan/chitin deacetylase (PgdA/CDA1 family)